MTMSRACCLAFLISAFAIPVTAATPAPWGEAPDAGQLKTMHDSLSDQPNPYPLGAAQEVAAFSAVRGGGYNQPVYWSYAAPQGTIFIGTATMDAPVKAYPQCRLVSIRTYAPDRQLSDLNEMMACQLDNGQWRFSEIVTQPTMPPASIRPALHCPDKQSSCRTSDMLIEHSRRYPTQSYLAYSAEAAAIPKATTVATKASPPPPAPATRPSPPEAAAPRYSQEALNRLLDEVVERDSQSWGFNQYSHGSMSDSRIVEGSGDSFTAVGYYSYTTFGGTQNGNVHATFKGGKLDCLEYYDQQGVCRPLGFSLSKQFLAQSNNIAPEALTKGETFSVGDTYWPEDEKGYVRMTGFVHKSDAYWSRFHTPMLRNVFSGAFSQVAVDTDFKAAYLAYVQAFNDRCPSSFSRAAHTLTITSTETTKNGFGSIIDQTSSERDLTMEPKFVETFEAYFYAPSIKNPIGGVVQAQQGNYDAIINPANAVADVKAFFAAESCKSAAVYQLGENLVRRAANDVPVQRNGNAIANAAKESS